MSASREAISVRAASDADRAWIAQTLCESWSEPRIVARGRVIDAGALPALLAEGAERLCGLLTYELRDDAVEIATLDAAPRRAGVGTALVEALARLAATLGASRIEVVTTNDNLDALRFYQRRGFRLERISVNAVEASRQLKPSIPVVGEFGIPIRDELLLVRRL